MRAKYVLNNQYDILMVTFPLHCQVDPAISASFYFIKSLLHKQEKNFAEFYKSSLLYLAFISSEALPRETKLVRLSAYFKAH